MAYYNSSGASRSGYKRARRAVYPRRKRYVASAKGVSPYRKTPKMSGGTRAASKTLLSRLKAIEDSKKLGEPKTVFFDAEEKMSFYHKGIRVGEEYFEVPVSEMLRLYMASTGVETLRLSSVVVEADVHHVADVETFAMMLPRLPGSGSPVAVFPETGKFVLGYGGGGGQPGSLCTVDNHRVQELANDVFKTVHRDGSLFGAELSENRYSRVSKCDSKVNGGRTIPHSTGRAALVLRAQGSMNSVASVAGKTTLRQHWRLEKQIRMRRGTDKSSPVVLDTEHVLFCGVRPRATMHSDEKSVMCGWIENLRVTLYMRHK